MFHKRFCGKCGIKTSKKHFFCPECGNKLKNNEENLGMLGKNDFPNESVFQNNLLGGFGGRMISKMLGNALKMLEKEMQKETKIKNQEKAPRTHFNLMINGKEVKFNNQVNSPAKNQEKIPRMDFEKEQIKYFTQLPKKEPKTSLRRMGDRIIYELKIPEVKSPKDIIVNKLENSIEVKAVGKTRAYFKVIPINMPIISQKLSGGKLVLELKEE